MLFPSRRVALAALAVAVTLGGVAAFIALQTTSSPPEPREASPVTPRDPSVLPPVESAATAPSAGTLAPEPAASGAPPNDAEGERALAGEIRALVAAGRIGQARSRASAYYARFPHGPSAQELERLTGAHPTRDATDTRP